jgi:hypothetical protein
MNNILANILQSNTSTNFYTFSNADGKQWIMPQKYMPTAMSLYQPSSVKGKWMKKYFPYLYWIKFLQNQLRITIRQYELQSDLECLLSRIFYSNTIDFSVFCGTSSPHQKVTMQISNKNKILGYCKLSDKKDIKILFIHEQKILQTLKEKGISQIPECLYCNILKDNIYLFIQSTNKTNYSKVLHKWNSLCWRFLSDLKKKTEQIIPFEQTDFFHNIKLLQQGQSYLSDNDMFIVNSTIDEVLNYYKNSNVIFSVYHGDFTPWNMFVENNQLFVFDWEYAKLTYPPMMDFFHFYTQTYILEKHLDIKQIYKHYRSVHKKIMNYIENPTFLYKCYLLEIITLYMQRDINNCDNNTKKIINDRIELLSLLNSSV